MTTFSNTAETMCMPAGEVPPPGVDSLRVTDLRRRVLEAMNRPIIPWTFPQQIDPKYMSEPVAVRKARAIALKLATMPTDLWDGQLFAGSMTMEGSRLHTQKPIPKFLTPAESEDGSKRGLKTSGGFGHIVPDYPKLLEKGLVGIAGEARQQFPRCANGQERDFLESVIVATEGVIHYAARLAERCRSEAGACADASRASELRKMADNLMQVPAGPPKTFWQALQSVWLLHMVFHSTLEGNALGRVDQYTWPFLQADLAAGRISLSEAAELVDCFCLKFNERAKTTEDQMPDHREEEPINPVRRTRHYTSSQLDRHRDSIDATNHWLQNIIVGGLRPDGGDGANPVSFLLLESYRRHQMTNPLLTVRMHRRSPRELVARTCEALKEGGGMPAIFNDEAIIPALERIGIPTPDARDYTNDGCWEVIIPGRTDFRFQRLSVMLCLEWALNRGRSRLDGSQQSVDTGNPREFRSFDDVWRAFETHLDAMVRQTEERVVERLDDRSVYAPVPLLSALIDGTIQSRRDMTAGGAKFRTFALLAEGAAHAIDSLAAIKTVVFEQGLCDITQLCDAMDSDFHGHELLRRCLQNAPKYGNDDNEADEVGRRMIQTFTDTVARHARAYESRVKFPCGVGTFSWYIGIGEGLGASADGRGAGQPVSSNFSPALGMDAEGLPAAILSYSKMHHTNLPAGGPLDLRLARRLVTGQEGTERMAGLLRGFVDSGGSMMTLTVVDTEELRAAQKEPQKYRSLRVRMGGWCAYFTMLSRQQQDHHIHRQEGRK